MAGVKVVHFLLTLLLLPVALITATAVPTEDTISSVADGGGWPWENGTLDLHGLSLSTNEDMVPMTVPGPDKDVIGVPKYVVASFSAEAVPETEVTRPVSNSASINLGLPGATYCKDAYFAGHCAIVTTVPGACYGFFFGLNNEVTSFRANEGSHCIIFKDPGCDGDFIRVGHRGINKMAHRKKGWNDVASSFSCWRKHDDRRSLPESDTGNESVEIDSDLTDSKAALIGPSVVTLCTGPNFKGRCWRLDAAKCTTLRRTNRDRVSSMLTNPGVRCRIWDDNNCQGGSRTIKGLVRYLRNKGAFGERMNSIRCHATGHKRIDVASSSQDSSFSRRDETLDSSFELGI